MASDFYMYNESNCAIVRSYFVAYEVYNIRAALMFVFHLDVLS